MMIWRYEAGFLQVLLGENPPVQGSAQDGGAGVHDCGVHEGYDPSLEGRGGESGVPRVVIQVGNIVPGDQGGSGGGVRAFREVILDYRLEIVGELIPRHGVLGVHLGVPKDVILRLLPVSVSVCQLQCLQLHEGALRMFL